jgi:serine/threonine protein kinase
MTYPTREQPISELILTSGGGFADVFRGVSDGMLVGVKRSRLGPDTRSTEEVQNARRVHDYTVYAHRSRHQAFRKEAILWHHLDHPRLLPFLGVDEEVLHTSGRIDLVMPWMAGGTLRDFIRCEDYSPARDRLRLVSLFVHFCS